MAMSFGIRAAVLLLCVASLPAFGGGAMTVSLRNNTSGTLLVTVYDLNARGQRILSSEEINSFASIDVSISADPAGYGRVKWTATNTDPDFRRCGHHTKGRLRPGEVVAVYANSDCGAS